jgi:hypothetical protein
MNILTYINFTNVITPMCVKSKVPTEMSLAKPAPTSIYYVKNPKIH